jgi:hypothetical protein
MMGRVASGEPAYRATATPSLTLRMWHRVMPYFGILPAFVAEQVATLTAIVLAGFCEPLAHCLAELAEPLPSLAERLMDFAHRLMHITDRIGDIADRLHLWRLHATPHREHIWLSIRY